MRAASTKTKPETRGCSPGNSSAIAFSDKQTATMQLLVQHRYATARSLQDMHYHLGVPPMRKFNDHLTNLKNGGYINKRIGGIGQENMTCWHATELGVQTVCHGDQKLDRGWLHNPLSKIWPYHSLLANQVGLRFCEISSILGDQCDPFAWEHEIAFKYRKSKRAEPQLLISDMILHYTAIRNGQTTLVPLIIELDRGTQGVNKLIEKIQKYKYLHSTPDAWIDRFPAGFPRLLIIAEDGRKGSGGRDCAKAIWETYQTTEMPQGFNVGIVTKKVFFNPAYEQGPLGSMWGPLGIRYGSGSKAISEGVSLFSLAPPKRRARENGGNRLGN